VGVALVLSACRVDATTRVDVADDGSGTVTVEVVLDAEAAARIPDLARQLRADDLTATGWTITDPEPGDDGSVTITATKPFADPDQLAAVLDEVGGRLGPVRDVAFVRERSFGRTAYDFSATLDLSAGVRTFSDRRLTQVLDGAPVGQDIAAIEAEVGVPVEEMMGYRFEITLPEGEETVTSAWDLALGEGPVEVAARTEETNRLALGLAAASALALVLLVLVLVVRLVRRGRR
jgi:hypothetical protein